MRLYHLAIASLMCAVFGCSNEKPTGEESVDLSSESEEPIAVMDEVTITDEPEDEELVLRPLEDSAFVKFLASSEKGWVEAIKDGDGYIVASDDPEEKISEFKVFWSNDGRYFMDLNKARFTIGAVVPPEGSSSYDFLLFTEEDIAKGNVMGRTIWMDKLNESTVQIDYFDPMNARVVDTKAFIPHCEAFICRETDFVIAHLKSVDVVEGFLGLQFETVEGGEYNFWHLEIDPKEYEGVLWNHVEDESVFGKYEILTDQPIKVTYVKKMVANLMEPEEIEEAEVLLDMEIVE